MNNDERKAECARLAFNDHTISRERELHVKAAANVKRIVAVPLLRDTPIGYLHFFASEHDLPNPERLGDHNYHDDAIRELADLMVMFWRPPPPVPRAPGTPPFSSDRFFPLEWKRIQRMVFFRLILRRGQPRASGGIDDVSFCANGVQLIQMQPPALLEVAKVKRMPRTQAVCTLPNSVSVLVPQEKQLFVMLPCRAKSWCTLPTLRNRLGPARQRPALPLSEAYNIFTFVCRLHFLYEDPAAVFHASVQEVVRASASTPDSDRVWSGFPVYPDQLGAMKSKEPAQQRTPLLLLARKLRLEQEAAQKKAEEAEAKAAIVSGRQLFSFAMSADARRLQAAARDIADSPVVSLERTGGVGSKRPVGRRA